jgi:PKD repeat protein
MLAIALSPDTICPQGGVAVQNLSSGEAISAYLWNFGNGQTFSGFAPADSIYYQPGIEDTIYTITLTISGACPDAVASATLLVLPLPYLSLVPSLDNTCSGDTVSFSLGTTGGSIFNITFSAHDTTTVGLPLPALTFFTPNDSTRLTVVAVVAGENQCAATSDTAIIQILPNEANAFCDLNLPVICVGDTLVITNGATPLNAQVSYDFGDGSTSNDPNPRKVYSQAGAYKIRQTARTFCGYDFVDRWIQVNPAPPVGFAHDAYRCVGDSMHFWLTVDSFARTVDWDFGFGNVSSVFRPAAVFPQSGMFPVTLTITLDSSGCDASLTQMVEIKANPVAQFTASDTLACGRLETTLSASPAGPQYNYGWFASNGNTAAGNPANFVFSDSGSYSVRLLVQDLWGCQDDTALFVFRVFPVPNSNFSLNLNWHCGFPATVLLNEQASPDALGFEWLFPDGSSSTSNNTAQTFLQAGDFPIRLRVSNIYGCSDDTTRVFRVFEQPVARFTITEPNPCQFSILEIDNQSEHANAWLWTFHYGDTSHLETPQYAFQQPGVFDISLVAMRDSFCFDTLTLTDVVDIKPAPEAGFFVVDSMPNGYPEGLIYIFSTATGAEAWDYDFGNGQGSSLENPVVRYGQNIRDTIRQIVSNQWMCRDTAWLDIIPAPFGGLFVPNAFAPEVIGGDYAYFMPKGRGLANYRVRVYAPTGKMVFESTELINGSPGKGWDGNDFNGKPCQQGAYAWVIEAEYETSASNPESLDAGSRKVVESGSVLLLR